MKNCAVIGAAGYTGLELVKILLRHPSVRIAALTTRQEEPIPLRRLIPALAPDVNLKIVPYSFEKVRRAADVVFLCLPHTEAMQTAAEFRRAKKIVIDLSADFRLRDAREYKEWYKVPHQNAALLKEAAYGLPEMYREKIRRADLIANPGCYPTAAILGIAPLLEKKLVEPDSIVIDAKSGVSGAGRKLNPATQFCEINENFYAYKIGAHQHTPEINQTLTEAAGEKISVTFAAHLLPLERGILSTIYLKKKKSAKAAAVRKAFKESYAKEPFVRVKPEGAFPALRDVQRTNFCDIGLKADEKSGRVIVVTAIDNLLKGASGQAVQNMNIRLGFKETDGLKTW